VKAKALVLCMSMFYGIFQEQLPCNFSITCLMGRPTIKQALFDGWTGKPRVGGKVERESKRKSGGR